MAPTQAARRGAGLRSEKLVKSQDGSGAGQRQGVKRERGSGRERAQNLPGAMRVSLAAGAACLALFLLLQQAPSSAEAKTHPSKRQAQLQQQQQQQQQQPSTTAGRDQTNWWNLWWQQYIDEAQQPTVRPIVAVSFNGQTIEASGNYLNDIERARPNEPAPVEGQLRQAKSLGGQQQANWAAVKPKMFQLRQAHEQAASARSNRQASDERPVLMMQQRQRRPLDVDDQMNQIQLSARPQVGAEFGIQMRSKAARQQQASSSNQRAFQQQQQELERLRQREQYRQQAPIDSEYLEQQQLQHQVSDYADEPELEQNAFAQNGTSGQASVEDNEVQTPGGAVDSSSSGMMMPERPRTTTRQQEAGPASSSSTTTTTRAPTTAPTTSAPATVRGRADTPTPTGSPTSTEASTSRRPESSGTPTTSRPVDEQTATSTASSSSTQQQQQQQQQQETSGTTEAARSTTQAPLTTISGEQEAGETPISFGANEQRGAPSGGPADGSETGTQSTSAASVQREQPKQTTAGGQDRVELQNGRPATSGLMFVSGRPQLFGTSASTTTTAAPTSTTSATSRSGGAQSGGPEVAGSASTEASSESTKSTTPGSPANASASGSTDSESDSDDESEDEQPGSSLSNSAGADSSAGDSDSDGEEESEGDESGDSEGGAEQAGGTNATSTTSGSTQGAGSGGSSASSEATTQQPMLTTSEMDIERVARTNASRGQTTTQPASAPASVETGSTTNTESGRERPARVTDDGSALSTTVSPSAKDSPRQQQVLMMTVDTSRGTLDGEGAITVPMDAVMRMMMGQKQMGEQATTPGPSLARGEQENRQATSRGTTQPATGDASSSSGTTGSTSGRLIEQGQPGEAGTTSGGGQQRGTSAAPTSSPDSMTTNTLSTTRKKLQPPPTTRVPGASTSSSPASAQTQASAAPVSEMMSQQEEGRQSSSSAATSATSSVSGSSRGAAENELMSITTSAMSLDDEGGGREPKIELINMDLVPIQRIMSSSSTTSRPVGKTSQPRQMSAQTMREVEQAAMNVEVEPGMRLRPPSGQQPRVTMIESVRPSTMRMQQQQASTSSRPPVSLSMMSSGPVSVSPSQMNQMSTVYMIMMPPEFAANNTAPGQQQHQSSDLRMMMRNQEEQSTRERTSQMKQMLAMLQTAAEQERAKTEQQKPSTMRMESQPASAATSAGTTPARPLPQTTMLGRSSQQPTGGQTSTTGSSRQRQEQPTMTTSGQQLMRLGSMPDTGAGGALTQTVPPSSSTTARPRFISEEEFLGAARTTQQPAGASDRSPGPTRMRTSGQQTTMAQSSGSSTAKPAGGSAQTGVERRTTTAASSSTPTPVAATTTTTSTSSSSITTTTSRPSASSGKTMAPTGGHEREGQPGAEEEPVKAMQPLMVVVQLQNGTRVATPVSRMPPSDTLAALRQSTSAAEQRPLETTQPAPPRRPAGAKTSLAKTSPLNATGSFIPAKLRQDFGAKPASQTINEISAGAGAADRKMAKSASGVSEPQWSANRLAQQQQQQSSTTTSTPSPMVQSMAIRQFGGANRMSALAQQPVAFGRPATMMIVPGGQSASTSGRLQQAAGAQYLSVPSFEYGPSIAVRRPDEPLANGQMPNCTLTGKNFCVLTKDYPMNEVRQAVERSFRSVRIMYEELQTVSDQELHKDDFKNATSSQAASGRFACQTQVEMMRPGWAKDEITREWMLVVNTDVFPQRVRSESCAQPNTPCEFIAPFYDSTCQQRYSLHRMIAIDPHDPTRSPQVAVFKFPAGCVCRVHPIRKGSPTLAPTTPLRQTTTTSPMPTTSSASTPTTNVPKTTINVATSTSIRRRR